MTHPSPTTSAASPRRARELTLRLATAAVGIPILLAVVLVGGPVYVAVVAAVLAVAAWELCHAAGLRQREPLTLLAMAAAAALALSDPDRPLLPLGVLSALALTTLIALVVEGQIDGAAGRWAVALAAPGYVGVLGSHFALLRDQADGRDWVLLAILGTFAVDTGAYAVGRLLGRRKLAPRISPGKTVAGAVGGLLGGMLVTVTLNVALGLDENPALMAALGLVLAVAAETGDLGESLLKRSLGVKDMGRLFPGHGGLLDRMDSLLFAVPVVYWGARWITG